MGSNASSLFSEGPRRLFERAVRLSSPLFPVDRRLQTNSFLSGIIVVFVVAWRFNFKDPMSMFVIGSSKDVMR
jgi:hypothetical protein